MASYITPGKRKRIYECDGYRCRYCGKTDFKDGEISIDHIIPRSKGGSNDMSNLVTACHKCNISKHAKTPEEAGMQLMNDPRE